jgi:hypothetical protein
MKHRSLWLLLSLAGALSCVAPALARSGGDGAPSKPPSGPNPKLEAAMRACAAEQGATPPVPGRPPADGPQLDMAKFEACMTAKGFPKPKGPPPQGGQPPAQSVQPPAG